jgi:hypothetical protein
MYAKRIRSSFYNELQSRSRRLHPAQGGADVGAPALVARELGPGKSAPRWIRLVGTPRLPVD